MTNENEERAASAFATAAAIDGPLILTGLLLSALAPPMWVWALATVGGGLAVSLVYNYTRRLGRERAEDEQDEHAKFGGARD